MDSLATPSSFSSWASLWHVTRHFRMMDPTERRVIDAAAMREFLTEEWTLYAVGVAVTITRTYARIRLVGVKGLQGDDYLVWLAMMFYTAETSLAHSVVVVAMGLANNGMTDAQRSALDPNSQEYRNRVVGSKIQIAGMACYSATLWTLKASLLILYLRLTAGLGRRMRLRVLFGFGFLLATYAAATLNLFLGCRPFHKNWQINPNPGNSCRPAISTSEIWVYASLNVASDLYLLSIPVPLLWQTKMPPMKKTGLIVLFSGGLFIIACAFIRAENILTNTADGAKQAGEWAVRESFVAVVTTNLPLIFPLIQAGIIAVQNLLRDRNYVKPISGASGGDHRKVITIGQLSRSPFRRAAHPIPESTFSESEERILNQNQGGTELRDLPNAQTRVSIGRDGNEGVAENCIIRQVEVEITSAPARGG